MNTKVWFNPLPLLLGTGLFTACTAWLALGPETSRPIGRVLSGYGGAVTIIATACGLLATLLFGFHTVRMILRLPALAANDDVLSLYIWPVERLRWSEVEEVTVDAGKLMVVMKGGRSRRISLAILGDCDTAVAEIGHKLAERRRRPPFNA